MSALSDLMTFKRFVFVYHVYDKWFDNVVTIFYTYWVHLKKLWLIFYITLTLE